MKFAIILSIHLIIGSNSSYVGSENILGDGSASCGSWTAEKILSDSNLNPMEEWVLRFVSAFAKRKEFDQKKIFDWVDHYCRANPHAMVYDATKEYIWLNVPDPDHPIQL